MGLFSGIYGDSNVSDYAYSSGSGSSALIDREGLSSGKAKRVIKNLAQSHTSDFEQICYYFQTNDTKTALQLKDSLYDDISNTLSTNYNLNISDDEIDSMLDQAYASYTGTTMMGTIQENTNDSFMTGFLEGIPFFGRYQNENSQAEAVAQLSGTKVSEKELKKEKAGKAVGFGTSCGTILGGVGFIGGVIAGAKCSAFGAKVGAFAGPIGAAVGAGVGFLIGAAGSFFLGRSVDNTNSGNI